MTVKQITTGGDGHGAATLDDMNDGERLRALLDKHGKKNSDLERVLGKSRQMVHIYLKTPRYSSHMRDTIRRGLEKLGIDAGELTDDPTAITDPAELRRLLDRIPHDALRDVKRMLEIQDRATRMGLVALIDDRIERKK